MFTNVMKKTKKFELEKIQKYKKNSSWPSFIFALYTLISPNLQIILKRKLHTQIDFKEVL